MAEPAPATRPTLLVVDDERNIRRTLDLVLRGDGYDVVEAPDAEEALDILEAGERHVDLAILDINLPGMSGVELLAQIRLDPTLRDLPVIVISGHAAREDVAQAIKLGAADFFEKPLGRDRVLVSVQNALHAERMAREVASLSAEASGRHEMIGESPAMKRLHAEIERVAPTRAGVLVTGETGTGKELVCRALHHRSARAAGPFVKINCAAIPAHLVESELFGFERGAFSGAEQRKRGLFEVAHGGTLFLDEIGDMDLAAQAKVLRALEYGEITRVGGLHPTPGRRPPPRRHPPRPRGRRSPRGVSARTCTTGWRSSRSAPVPRRAAGGPGPAGGALPGGVLPGERSSPAKTLAADALAELGRRRFPGNVRELRNLVERAAILAGDTVTVADLAEDPHADPFADPPAPPVSAENLSRPEKPEEEPEEAVPPDVAGAEPEVAAAQRAPCHRPRRPAVEAEAPRETAVVTPVLPPLLTLRAERDRAERAHIVEALRRSGWNIRQAASMLEVERTNLHKRIRYFGIRREG